MSPYHFLRSFRSVVGITRTSSCWRSACAGQPFGFAGRTNRFPGSSSMRASMIYRPLIAAFGASWAQRRRLSDSAAPSVATTPRGLTRLATSSTSPRRLSGRLAVRRFAKWREAGTGLAGHRLRGRLPARRLGGHVLGLSPASWASARKSLAPSNKPRRRVHATKAVNPSVGS